MTVVFFDGVCGLCNRLVRFLLRRDRRAVLRFAPLQGPLARETLGRYGMDPADLDSVVAVANWGTTEERTFTRSRAVLEAVGALGGGWGLAAAAARVVPSAVGDAVYRLVARHRYRLFGRSDACPLPPAHWRGRFLD